MRSADQLATFVRDALSSGKSRDDIGAALAAAGWTPNEVAGALNGWSDSDFVPAVPRPRPFVSAQEAFVYGLMFVALAMTAFHLVSLSFELIDRWLPEAFAPRPYYTSQSGIRWSIAALVVFAPLFLILNNRVVRATRSDPGKRRSAVRKWFGYITLFITALVLLGDMLYTIYALLNGDLTLRFLAKAIVTAVVAGVIFLYFRQEIREAEDAR